ncbi:MAG: NAD-binding protein [Gammaproteobacteria bacterium]|nr:NAD-binding protein [Gammaproteobacteria bacterium]MCZ6855624.1 NAD-binding protein [Gammaproteobacteria bacterium]
MAQEALGSRTMNWRWPAALVLFLLAFGGLLSGVSLSERPDVVDSGILTKAYYSLGLFVVGGIDLGTPEDGSVFGRMALWLAYFGAPALTASAVVEAVITMVSPNRWKLRRLRNHIVIVGTGGLTTSYLRVLRKHTPNTSVVVVDEKIEFVREQELRQTFNVNVISGDITHDFLLGALRLDRAVRIMLLGEDDFQSYEAASKILRQFPHLKSKIVLHCYGLRFMRAMQETAVAKQSVNFNLYNLAAAGLVHDHLIGHFRKTESRDVVVIAGFGRFGQTVLEELQTHAANEIATVGIIDIDADRRVLVADEQRRLPENYRREVFQGDIAHPEVWQNLAVSIDLAEGEPTVIIGTGRADENLRTALWLKQNYPNTMVFARTNDKSELALEVGAEHDINCFSIKQLIEDNIPSSWLNHS